MVKLPFYTIDGKKKEAIDAPKTIFALRVHPDLLHQAVVYALANQRRPYAHAKDRSEVRGGGRKPWRQKGTGQARHGSRRSPLWVGGGVTFGPRKEQVFAKNINKKMRQKALLGALSRKAAEEGIAVVEHFLFDEEKTKLGVKFLKATGITGTVVLWGSQDDKGFLRVFGNVSGVTPRRIENINILDVMNHAHGLFSQSALNSLIKSYGNAGLVPQKAGAGKANRAEKAS